MDKQIEAFLTEDIGTGDVTTDAIVPEGHTSKADIIAKADGVLAGHIFAQQVFHALDRNIRYEESK
jgi:nicotinate-nucleotide pyrophosphorylase (carboxylating)